MEKALTRGDFLSKELVNHDRFRRKYTVFHNIQNYFKEDTYLRFEGDKYVFTYSNGSLEVEQINGHDYVRPQIVYIPSERNLLSVVDQAEKIKGLPTALDELLGVYRQALRAIPGTENLPVSGYSVQYDKSNQIVWLKGKDFKISLTESASGFQSMIPTILVSRYLLRLITDESLSNSQTQESKEESERREKTIVTLLKDKTLDDSTRLTLINQLSTNKSNGRLINIIEEIEQNLFPVSQQLVLNDLLKTNNRLPENQMVFTTHSPYILNYLSLAVKAGNLSDSTDDGSILSDICSIVPKETQVRGKDVAIYEITDDGEISIIKSQYGIPDDNNFLNNALGDANDMYDRLMDLEDRICRL